MMDNKAIGRHVKKYRRIKNLTQDQLAEAVDISTVHMSHIETGSVCMSMDCLLKVCSVLEITPNHLLLSDFNLKKDPGILEEKLERLTEDEMRLVLSFTEMLGEARVNRGPHSKRMETEYARRL